MRDIIKMVVVLTLICTTSGLALSLVKQVTEVPREYSYLKFVKEPSILAVLSGFDNDPVRDRIIIQIGEDAKGQPVERQFFPAKKAGETIAVAFDTSANGYGGSIEVMVGVDKEGKVTAVAVMSHSETPGLGARVVEPTFKNQFAGMELSGALNLAAKGGRIEAVTGASVSSGAVVSAVREALELFPKIKQEVFPS